MTCSAGPDSFSHEAHSPSPASPSSSLRTCGRQHFPEDGGMHSIVIPIVIHGPPRQLYGQLSEGIELEVYKEMKKEMNK